MRPWLGEAEAEAAAAVVRTGWVAQGPRVTEFEDAFAARVGASNAVAVSNCTAGLHLALIGAGVGAGDEVVVPSLSFIASTNAPLYVGATPVFADVDIETGNVTVESVESVITERTRAVLVVHQAGVPADIESIRSLCDRLGLAMLEDAACAIGSTYRGQIIGAHSDFVAFSFHPRKLVTTGEGGMVTVADPAVASRLRRLREHGMSMSAAERHHASGIRVEEYLETGYNYRMTDIQAAVGLVQLSKLDPMVERRRSFAVRYQSAFADLEAITCVKDPPFGTSNYQSFWVLLDGDATIDRNELMERLSARGISTRRGIMAAHLEPACAHLQSADLPNTERLARDSMILPIYHEMTDADQERVIEAVRDELA
jgi:dTDP-4-amino-4,6-dideoxygalactose transaminase